MKTLLVLVLAASAVPLFAQIPPVVSQEIVVTASGIEEDAASTPAALTVIHRTEIEAREARDVADLLREVPGLTLSRSGSGGKATSLFTRGSNSTHTLVLWNGMEINNPYFAGYDWGRFSTAGVERVEVVRGPYSALYGSDAVAGTVNILTAPGAPLVSVDVQSGERGLLNGSAAGAIAAGDLSGSASVERRLDEGWLPNDDFEQNAGGLTLDWRPGPLSAGLRARYTDYKLGVPMNLNAPGTELVPSLSRRQDGSESQLLVPVTWQSRASSITLRLSQSRRDDDFADPEDPYGYTSGTTRSTTSRADLSFQLGAGALGTVVAGAEYERALVDDASNFGVSLDGEVRTSRAIFLEDRFSLALSARSRLEGSVGVRRDEFDTFGGQTSPRAALAWIRGMTKVRAAFGDAFRAPSVGELYFPYSGNAELRPESSRSWEAGVDRELASGRASVTLFHASYRDLIMFDNETYRFVNVGAATAEGVELGAARRFSNGLSTTLSYTRLRTRGAESGESLPRRPDHSGSASLGWHSGRFRSTAILSYTGERADVLPVRPYSPVTSPAYTTVDLVLGYSFGRLDPYVKVENLTGEKYQEVLGFPSPGRRAIAGVRFTR